METAVVEPRDDLRHKFETSSGLKTFSSVAEARNWLPDGVIVAVPTDKHEAVIRELACFHGPLMIEKPLAATRTSVSNIMKIVQNRPTPTFVMANMRCHIGPRMLKENIGKIGKVFSAYSNFGSYLPDMRLGIDYRSIYASSREKGGGVLLDCIHEFDYLNWILGASTLRVAALSRISDLKIDVEDHATVVLSHVSGAISTVELDYLQRVKLRGCRLSGHEGTLIWQSLGKKPENIKITLLKSGSQIPDVLFEGGYDLNTAYESYLAEYLKVIGGKSSSVLLSADEAAKESNLLFDILDANCVRAGTQKLQENKT
ncbi:hypothetical protein TH19_03455 [Thalassospira profundimaris]|uniref:Gfo/Idh/MocA-like oxidoreductase N-terminal domain-containing protein n=1 Tax=Thalassospira profundimaris TaxID=502049 RepID=A0A367WBS5_9PROT|nr:hypothetical protein TH19_03455 [Thalassospira profundimaris]